MKVLVPGCHPPLRLLCAADSLAMCVAGGVLFWDPVLLLRDVWIFFFFFTFSFASFSVLFFCSVSKSPSQRCVVGGCFSPRVYLLFLL